METQVSVLVVEDDPDLRRLHRLWLADEYDVRAVCDGESALEAADATVDVVLLDRDLPGIDGDTVARRLDADGFRGSIAMVTGQAPDPPVATLPIDDYVTKPVDAAELGAIVDRLIARQAVPPAVRTLFGLLSRRARLEANLDASRLADADQIDELARQIDDQWETVRRKGAMSEVPSMAEQCLAPVVEWGAAFGSAADRTVATIGDSDGGQDF